MHRLNPGYKLLTLIIASLILSLTYNIKVNLLVFAVCFLLTICTKGVNRKALFIALCPFFLAALGMFTTGLLHGNTGTSGIELAVAGQRVLTAHNIKSGMQLASRILAYGGLGMLFAFTSGAMELIMSLMQQFHLPPRFAYGILAAYHFFPVLRHEFGIVGASLRLRGIKASPFSQKRLFPMLVHALQRSESLAMAMESRGFESGQPRAVAFPIALRWYDFAFLIGFNALIALGLILL